MIFLFMYTSRLPLQTPSISIQTLITPSDMRSIITVFVENFQLYPQLDCKRIRESKRQAILLQTLFTIQSIP